MQVKYARNIHAQYSIFNNNSKHFDIYNWTEEYDTILVLTTFISIMDDMYQFYL